VDRPGLRIVQYENIKDKWQGRGVPELKQGPDQGYEKEDFLRDHASRIAGTGFSFSNHLLHCSIVYLMIFILLFTHTALPPGGLQIVFIDRS